MPSGDRDWNSPAAGARYLPFACAETVTVVVGGAVAVVVAGAAAVVGASVVVVGSASPEHAPATTASNPIHRVGFTHRIVGVWTSGPLTLYSRLTW
jgi:hypothetical protein